MRRLLPFLLLVQAGCGYHLHNELAPPAGIHTVQVPTFVNRTYQPGLELPFTANLRTEVMKGRGLELVTDRAKADAVVSGEVTLYRAVPTVLIQPPNFPQNRLRPTRYRAILDVHVTVVSTRTGELLWDDTLEGTSEFDAGVAPEGFEPVATDAQQRNAVALIAADLMHEAYDRIVTDF